MKIRTSLILTALTLAGVVAAHAQERASVLAGDGALYSVQAGRYGELFPEGSAAPADQPVLALDVQRGDAAVERSLIDGTADDAVEDDVLLFFEDSSETLYLLWQQAVGDGDATLALSGLRGGEWSEAIEVAGSAATRPGSSSLAVTRDSFETLVEGATTTWQRTVLHVVWQAGAAASDAEPMYTAVILEDGEFIGFNPVVRLTDLVSGSGGSAGGGEAVLGIESGVDSKAAIIGFTDPRNGHVVTVESRLIPMELSRLALQGAHEVMTVGRDLPPTAGLDVLAQGVGSSILELGYRFHAGLTTYFANETETLIVDVGNSASGPGVVLENVAGPVGSSIIEMGLRAFGTDGMNRVFEPGRLFSLAVSSSGQIDLDRLFEATEPPHLIRLYVVSDRPAPDSGDGEGVVVSNSKNGESSVVSWEGSGETIEYRQSQGETWSPAQSLSLGDGLSREDARKILRDRVRNQ